MTNKIRCGIIGTGVGLRTYLPAFKEIANTDVYAIAGSNLERATSFARRFGIPHAMNFEDLCQHPEINLVCVASPNSFHRVQVLTALGSGKHVLCEKPLAMNIIETNELIEAAKAKPAQLALVNHQLRFNPYIKEVNNLLQQGKIGRPYFARIHQQSTGFSDPQALWSWSFDAANGGGVRLAMGSHLIDLVLHWFGNNIETVSGAMDPVFRKRKNDAGVEVPIRASGFFSASLGFSNGLNVQMSATAASFSSASFTFSIFGELGELHFNLTDKLRGAFFAERGKFEVVPVANVRKDERENRVSIFSGSFPYFASAIVDSIRTNNRDILLPAAKFQDAFSTQNVLDAIEFSANNGVVQNLTKKNMVTNYV